jgi:hypothetical protein
MTAFLAAATDRRPYQSKWLALAIRFTWFDEKRASARAKYRQQVFMLWSRRSTTRTFKSGLAVNATLCADDKWRDNAGE